MAVREWKDKQGNIVPNKFFIEYYKDGVQIRQVISRVSRGQAETIHLKLRRKGMKHLPADPQIIDVYPDWLTSYALDHSKGTIEDIEGAFLRLIPHFGERHLSQLDVSLFEDYMAKRLKDTWRPPIQNPDPKKKYAAPKPISKRTINKELKYMGLLLKYCVDRQHCLPLAFVIPKFKKLPKPKPKLLQPREVSKLLKELADHKNAYLAVLLYYDAGLRRDEGLQLSAENVFLDEDVIYVLGKGNKERTAPIVTARLKEALEERLKKVGKKGYLIADSKGKPYKDLRKSIQNAAERAGLGKRVYNHIFRHGYTTSCLEAGVDLDTVRENVGHESIRTTQGYLHTRTQHRVEETKKLAEYQKRRR